MLTIHNNHMFFNYYRNHLRVCVEPLAKSKCNINGSSRFFPNLSAKVRHSSVGRSQKRVRVPTAAFISVFKKPLSICGLKKLYIWGINPIWRNQDETQQ